MTDKRTDQKKPAHLSSEDIAAYVEHQVSEQEREHVIAHLADCVACRRLVARVVSSRKQVHDPNKPSSL